MKKQNRRKVTAIFVVTILVVILIFILSVVKVNVYNNTRHYKTFSGTSLFASTETSEAVSVSAVPRNSTWSKVFDINNEGLTEHNYQAYTYDFNICNNTKDEVSDFSFKLTFSTGVFLSSGWNGAIEIHQNTDGKEIVDTVPDLREYVPDKHSLEYVTFDGDTLIPMRAGDYLVYIPSSSMNAMEVPIEPLEGTSPGIILYTAIGESIENSTLEINYTFHRLLTSEPLFWIALIGFLLWLISLVFFVIISWQIKKYQLRHQRDNEIINESIETFTGFIDAKDPYTNGHSKRVAVYTKLIAQEMGFEGEELDRIYYVALLHDCGKIGVPDSILAKPTRLTDEEFEIMKTHTVHGSEILSSFKSLKNVGEGALYHHERYDGKGYPEGKKGEEIPLIARMIGVADTFDAMNTNRVYRKKLPKELIISEIEKNKGIQFDPDIADIMLDLIRNGKIPCENLD